MVRQFVVSGWPKGTIQTASRLGNHFAVCDEMSAQLLSTP
jgi:hypothetical protein